MEHSLTINLAGNPRDSNNATGYGITAKEKISQFLFGSKQKITIVVTDNAVRELKIIEVKGGKEHERRVSKGNGCISIDC